MKGSKGEIVIYANLQTSSNPILSVFGLLLQFLPSLVFHSFSHTPLIHTSFPKNLVKIDKLFWHIYGLQLPTMYPHLFSLSFRIGAGDL